MECRLEDMPLMLTRDEAAKVAGVGRDEIDRWLANAANPLPHVKSGRKVEIQKHMLVAYTIARSLGITPLDLLRLSPRWDSWALPGS